MARLASFGSATVFLLLVAVAAPPVAALFPMNTTGDLLVSTEVTSDRADYADQAAAAPLGPDRNAYAIVYRSVTATGNAIPARVIDALGSGSVGGAHELVATGQNDYITDPSVTQLANGRVVAVWRNGSHWFGRLLRNDTAAPVAPTAVLADATSTSGTAPVGAVESAFGGGFVIPFRSPGNITVAWFAVADDAITFRGNVSVPAAPRFRIDALVLPGGRLCCNPDRPTRLQVTWNEYPDLVTCIFTPHANGTVSAGPVETLMAASTWASSWDDMKFPTLVSTSGGTVLVFAARVSSGSYVVC